jgi:hypothetical protein
LVSFAGLGKDGAIDLSSTSNQRRHVVECKYIGEDGLDTARKRWAITRDHLRDNLTKFCEGRLTEKQYLPWTTISPRIDRYTFCVSSSLGIQEVKDKLEREIREFFLSLSQPQLAHLQSIQVVVRDAGDWDAACIRDPLLKFRWFPETAAIQGFLPLTQKTPPRGFRQYLTEDSLPYFSRRHFATTANVGWTEDSLLDHLGQPGNAGLILHAPGGAGKSRLGLELGLQAERRGWMVLRVHERAKPDNLAQIAGDISGRRTIFLFDYVESHPQFVELALTIQSWNEDLGLPVNFIANCRASYYGALAAQRLDHLSVDLDLRAEDSYRNSLVRQILQSRDLASERAFLICQDVPMRAVFLCYLNDTGRTSDLHQLLLDESFESWIKTKASATLAQFPVQDRIPKTAEFLAFLPFAHDSYLRVRDDPAWRPVLDAMKQDGWFEDNPAEPGKQALYSAPHDVFADTLLLTAVELQPATAEGFLLGILTQADDFGCVPSAFTAVQRIGARIQEGVVTWRRLFSDLLQSRPAAANTIRLQILTAPFIPARDELELLRTCPSLGEGLDTKVEFQNALGFMAQWLGAQPKPIQSEFRETLLPFVRAALTRVYRSNYLITQILHWLPEEARSTALRWCEKRLALLQTHYVLVAWLESGLESDGIRIHLSQWLAAAPASGSFRFQQFAKASFVYKSWLDAVTGGGKEPLKEQDRALVEEPIRHWLAAEASRDAAGNPLANRLSPEAEFVYKSWLDATTGGGKGPLRDHDRALVEESIRDWLAAEASRDAAGNPLANRLSPEARFVYKSWLDAVTGGGKEPLRDHDRALVEEPIRDWLAAQASRDAAGNPLANRLSPEASFVYKSWLDAVTGGGKEPLKDPDRALVEEPIRDWLAAQASRDAAGNPIANRISPEAQFVYKSWLDAAKSSGTELISAAVEQYLQDQHNLASWDPNYVFAAWFSHSGQPERLLPLFLLWLPSHGAHEELDFVLRRYLAAGLPYVHVAKPFEAWLLKFGTMPQAVYFWKDALRQPNLSAPLVCQALAWCRMNPRAAGNDAVWRLAQCRRFLGQPEIDAAYRAAAEVVLPSLATRRIGFLLAKVIQGALVAYLRIAEERSEAWPQVLLSVLGNADTFNEAVQAPPEVQYPVLVERVAALLFAGRIRPDSESISRFAKWVHIQWEQTKKASLEPVVERLCSSYPEHRSIWELMLTPKD